MKYHTYPSLKSEEDRQALWNGLLKGDIHTMATDEYCTSYALKIAGKTIEDVTGGDNGGGERGGINYTQGGGKRGGAVGKFFNLAAAQPPPLFGLYTPEGRDS